MVLETVLAGISLRKTFSRTEICGLHPLVPLIWTVTFKYMQDFPGISLQGELNCDNKRVQTLFLRQTDTLFLTFGTWWMSKSCGSLRLSMSAGRRSTPLPLWQAWLSLSLPPRHRTHHRGHSRPQDGPPSPASHLTYWAQPQPWPSPAPRHRRKHCRERDTQTEQWRFDPHVVKRKLKTHLSAFASRPRFTLSAQC